MTYTSPATGLEHQLTIEGPKGYLSLFGYRAIETALAPLADELGWCHRVILKYCEGLMPTPRPARWEFVKVARIELLEAKKIIREQASRPRLAVDLFMEMVLYLDWNTGFVDASIEELARSINTTYEAVSQLASEMSRMERGDGTPLLRKERCGNQVRYFIDCGVAWRGDEHARQQMRLQLVGGTEAEREPQLALPS